MNETESVLTWLDESAKVHSKNGAEGFAVHNRRAGALLVRQQNELTQLAKRVADLTNLNEHLQGQLKTLTRGLEPL